MQRSKSWTMPVRAKGEPTRPAASSRPRCKIVVGFLCTEAIEAALPIFKDAQIPVITPGVRTDSLTDRRDKTGWPVYRLAPRADAEGEAFAIAARAALARQPFRGGR